MDVKVLLTVTSSSKSPVRIGLNQINTLSASIFSGAQHGLRSVRFAPYQIFLTKCFIGSQEKYILVSKIYLKTFILRQDVSFQREVKDLWVEGVG